MLTIIAMVTMTTMIDYWLLLCCGGEGRGGGSIKSQFDVKLVVECKLVGMIWAQPPLDICGIVNARHCRCCCCGLLAGGGERAGLMRRCQLLGWTAMTFTIATVLVKKGLDKGKGEGELKDGLVFSCCLILLLFFWLNRFQCRLIDFLSRSSQYYLCWN